MDCTTVYYIPTEKYSPKSYAINFPTQVCSSQSEEHMMFFICKKSNISNQNCKQCFFFHVEKNDTSNQKPHIGACSL